MLTNCNVFIYPLSLSGSFCSMFRSVGSERIEPSTDPVQDLMNVIVERVDERGMISFTRARVTSEEPPTDIALNHSIYLLWAIGDNLSFDPLRIAYHGPVNRGASFQRIEFPSAADCPPIGKDEACFMHI